VWWDASTAQRSRDRPLRALVAAAVPRPGVPSRPATVWDTAQVTAPENPPRWVPDPLGRHQFRYWDGARWTDHVADDGVVGTDPPLATPAVDPGATPQPIETAQPIQPTEPTVPTGPTAPHAAGGLVGGQPSPQSPAGPEDAGWAAPTPSPAQSPVQSPAPSPSPYVPSPSPYTASPYAPAPASSGAPHGAASNAGGFGGGFAAPAPGTGAAAWAPVPRSYDPTRVLGRRYGAFAIDAVVCLIAFGIFFFATATSHTRAEMLRDPECHLSATSSQQVECDGRFVVTMNDTVYEGDFGVFAALSVVFTFLYFAVAEGSSGGSLGKHMTGIRVVSGDGGKIGVPRAILRWLVFAVDGPLSIYLCGIITSSVSNGHRRLGDMAASSYVIAKADAGRAVNVRPR